MSLSKIKSCRYFKKRLTIFSAKSDAGSAGEEGKKMSKKKKKLGKIVRKNKNDGDEESTLMPSTILSFGRKRKKHLPCFLEEKSCRKNLRFEEAKGSKHNYKSKKYQRRTKKQKLKDRIRSAKSNSLFLTSKWQKLDPLANNELSIKKATEQLRKKKELQSKIENYYLKKFNNKKKKKRKIKALDHINNARGSLPDLKNERKFYRTRKTFNSENQKMAKIKKSLKNIFESNLSVRKIKILKVHKGKISKEFYKEALKVIDTSVSKFENDFTLYGGVSDTGINRRISKIKFVDEYVKKFDEGTQKRFWAFVARFNPDLVKLSKTRNLIVRAVRRWHGLLREDYDAESPFDPDEG